MRLAFVLTDSPRLPAPAALETALRDFEGLTTPQWLDTTAAPQRLALESGGLELALAWVAGPIPGVSLDDAATHTLSWHVDGWAPPASRGHIVCLMPTGDAGTAELLRFTRAVAAVARATDAVGVYWPQSQLVHDAEAFIALAAEALPVSLWVGLRLERGARGDEVLSHGMWQFTLPELLLTAPDADLDVIDFFYDLLAYVVRRGEALPTGDTIGRSRAERLPIQYVPSPLSDDELVWLVELPRTPSTRAVGKSPTSRVKTDRSIHMATTKKKTTAKKSPTKKPAAKKVATKKSPARKAAAKKSPAKKAPARKAAAKKSRK